MPARESFLTQPAQDFFRSVLRPYKFMRPRISQPPNILEIYHLQAAFYVNQLLKFYYLLYYLLSYNHDPIWLL